MIPVYETHDPMRNQSTFFVVGTCEKGKPFIYAHGDKAQCTLSAKRFFSIFDREAKALSRKETLKIFGNAKSKKKF